MRVGLIRQRLTSGDKLMSRESEEIESVAGPKARRPFTLSARKTMTLVTFIGCVLGGVTLLSRPVMRAREASRRADCSGHLSQLALALYNYCDVYGVLPPAHIDDEYGRPMHSWRALILPFISEDGLYAQYDFSEPWDGPGNVKLLSQMPGMFSCPTRDAGSTAPTTTSYVVVSSPDTMFPGPHAIRLDQVTDGLSNTLMLVEVSDSQIPWTKPEDLDLRTMSLHVNDETHPAISSKHPGGANVIFGDRRYRFLRDSVTASQLKSLLTRCGGDPAPHDVVNTIQLVGRGVHAIPRPVTMGQSHPAHFACRQPTEMLRHDE
jgi:hypothetical protein